MSIEAFSTIVAAFGTITASVALILNVLQFRRLEKSIKGNTYQQLSLVALELKKMLLEYPELEYLYTKNAGKKRNQFIFQRFIGNYLDDAWYQRQNGLIDDDAWVGFDVLIREIVKEHPEILDLILEPNFSKGFREYVASKLASKEGDSGK